MAYRIYLTDSLYYMARQKGLVKRWIDIVQPPEMDNRSGDEIAADVINRIGLTWRKDDDTI